MTNKIRPLGPTEPVNKQNKQRIVLLSTQYPLRIGKINLSRIWWTKVRSGEIIELSSKNPLIIPASELPRIHAAGFPAVQEGDIIEAGVRWDEENNSPEFFAQERSRKNLPLVGEFEEKAGFIKRQRGLVD
ncbi:hypothetical protein HZC35_06645 [Candidatus Saganbacteria bacterium]|nr:hypothetical protein [Candidatus Saganbacteria bacterium]